MRLAARRDPGEAAIIEALRAAGCLVQPLSDPGVPDLLVAHHEMLYLLEVKKPIGVRGGDSQRGQHLTPAQVKWHARWRSYVTIVRTVEDALAAVGLV